MTWTHVIFFRAVCIILLLTGSTGVFAFSTSVINYQGELTDDLGAPLNGEYNLRFSIYSNVTGGSKVWPGSADYEQHNLVSIANGIFNVYLGITGGDNYFSPEEFNGQDMFLQVEICTSAGSGCSSYETLSPRQPMASVGYAFMSQSFKPGLSLTRDGNVLSLTTTSGSGSALSATSSSATGSAAAVYGTAAADSAAGVSGYNSGNGYGVFGGSNGGYGVYSNGDAHVNGDLTWAAKTGYLPIPTLEFVPFGCSYISINSITVCEPQTTITLTGAAPVVLPHGATITKMKAQWIDNSSTNNGELTLVLENDAGSYYPIATTTSSGASTSSSFSETTDFGSYSTVDNANHFYSVIVSLSRTDSSDYINFLGAVIEYTFTEPY